MIGLMTVGLVVLVRLKWHPLNAILSSSAFGILLFIPSCMVTSAIVDSVRFGVFNYETAREIGDFRVWRSVPMSATKITVQKYSSGHRARFSVTKAELLNWVDEIWKHAGPNTQFKREDIEKHVSPIAHSLEFAFLDLGSDLPTELIVYHGPVARNGASIRFWYDTATNTAYSRCSYW